jgi:hypothetical protein
VCHERYICSARLKLVLQVLLEGCAPGLWGGHLYQPPFGSPERVLGYLARYAHRVVCTQAGRSP